MNPTHIIPSLSGISLSNTEAERCYKLIINTLMNKGQLVWYIKHLAESANFKACTFIKNFNGLTGRFSEMPNVSYTWPLCLASSIKF